MAAILDFPIEILLQVFDYADSLHLKQVCTHFNQLIDFDSAANTNYWVIPLKILESAIRKVEFHTVPVHVIQQLPRNILADIILRSEESFRMNEENKTNERIHIVDFASLYPTTMLVVRSPSCFDTYIAPLNHPIQIKCGKIITYYSDSRLSVKIVREQKTCELDPIEITNRVKPVCQLIKINDTNTAMFMIENYFEISTFRRSFIGTVRKCSAYANNFFLYKEIISFCDWYSPDPDMNYFIKNQNLEAIQFISNRHGIGEFKILEMSIEMNAHIVFNKYFKYINPYFKTTIIDLINTSITHNNLYAFGKFLKEQSVIDILNTDVTVSPLGPYYNYVEMKCYQAIRLSCESNPTFLHFFNKFIPKQEGEHTLSFWEQSLTLDGLKQPAIRRKIEKKELAVKHKKSVAVTKNNLKIINKRKNQQPINKSQIRSSFHKKTHR